MGRRQTAEIELEPPGEATVEAPQTAPARRSRSKTEPRPSWRDRARKSVFWTFLGLAALGSIAAAYRIDQFLASDGHFMLPGNVDAHPNLAIAGVQYTQAARVAAVFAPDFGRSIYLLPVAERRRALMAIDWVREASVSRRWPNRVDVAVVERTPVAFAMLPQSRDASGTVLYEPALVDGEGVILNLPARARFALPVLYGMTREQAAPGRRERIRQVLELIAEVKGYTGQISEINAADTDNLTITYGVEQAGNPLGNSVRLMLGNQRYLSRLKNFLSNYGEIGRRLPNARLFDLRLDDRITAVEGASNAL
jgi:cell division protein FtsQ